MLAALLKPPMPAPAETMEMVAAHEGAVAIEVDADFVAGAAPRAPALLREGPGRGTRECERSRSRGELAETSTYVSATSSRAPGVAAPRARRRAPSLTARR